MVVTLQYAIKIHLRNPVKTCLKAGEKMGLYCSLQMVAQVCRSMFLFFDGGFYLDNDVELLRPLRNMVPKRLI